MDKKHVLSLLLVCSGVPITGASMVGTSVGTSKKVDVVRTFPVSTLDVSSSQWTYVTPLLSPTSPFSPLSPSARPLPPLMSPLPRASTPLTRLSSSSSASRGSFSR